MPLQKGTIDKKQLKKIKEEIFKNSKPSQKIKIIAVTKNHPYSSILSACENKIFDIGENKIQELELKIKNKKIPEKIKIHFIGRLQSNKVKKAVKLCDYIQSVNSSRLLKKINKENDVTFCVIEHNMELIKQLCNPIIVMVNGEVLVKGTFEEIIVNPDVIEAYLGIRAWD